jgi:nucleotide-binding universal stress UspA family protein
MQAATKGISKEKGNSTEVKNGLFEHVVVPISGYPPNERAIPVASSIAKQFRATLEFVSMLYDEVNHVDRIHLLHLLATRVDQGAFTTIEEGTDPAAFILDLIHRTSTLVVLAGGTSILGLPGSITVDTLRFAANPFVTVGPKISPLWTGPIDRIVVLLDGSHAAEDSLPTAVSWARVTGANIELIQVIDIEDVHRARVFAPDALEVGYLESVAESLETDVLSPVSFDVLHGTSHKKLEVISNFVGHTNGTIICMASNGSHHSHSMVASTTLRVISHAAVPVLVVRS